MRYATEISMQDAIKLMLRKYKLEGKHNAYLVVKAWEDVMGKMINKKTKSIYLKDETLYVSLNSSVLKQELSFGKLKIIELINEKIGTTVISNVELK